MTEKPDVVVTAIKCGKKGSMDKFDAEKIVSKVEECDTCKTKKPKKSTVNLSPS